MCQSTSEVRIQVFTINAKNLDCWNHPNMLSLENRMGLPKKLGEKRGFVPKVYNIKKLRQILFSRYPELKIQNFFT